jgi:stage II sporulation protein D
VLVISALRRRLCTVVVALLLVAGVQAVTGIRAASAAEIYPAPTSGTWTIDGHGLGHGHGLSQYGAQGGAIAGLNFSQILGFYYQHTTRVTGSAATLRVLLTGPSNAVTVVYKAGLVLRWSGGSFAIPTGASQWRLIAAGTGLTLQRLVGATWSSVRTGLPAQADFGGGTTPVRYLRSATLAIDYRGTVGAVRSGAGVLPINRVGLDDYTRGAVPREMPASWKAEALKAQAVAARSYGRYAWEHNAAAAYDICDTTQCQVYGGAAQFVNGTDNGIHEEPGSNAAVAATANQVLTYAGATIFAQFSAADGGWTVDGGQPYLLARADPYEQGAGGDYFAWTRTAAVSTVASRYGLARITQIQITGRDGHGDWGGRVTTAIVQGVYPNGSAASISTTGIALASALGLPHHWFRIRNVPPSEPTSVTLTAADHSALVQWSPPASSGSAAISGYSIAVYGRTYRTVVPATTRAYWLTGMNDGQAYNVQVWAISAAGEGPRVSMWVTPTASRDLVNVVPPARLFDTRRGYGALTPTHPMAYPVFGLTSIPATAKSVMLAVSVTGATTDGVLKIYPEGAPIPQPASIAYRSGSTNTVTVSVSLVPTGRLRLVPTAGSVQVFADQVGYTATAGSPLSVNAPVLVASLPSVPTGDGAIIPIRGAAGVPSTATAALVQVAVRSVGSQQGLRVWADGSTVPGLSQITVAPDNGRSNVVLVPIGASGAIRLGAFAAGVAADVTVIGYVAPPMAVTPPVYQGHQVTLIPARLTAAPVTVTPTSVAVAAQGVAGVPIGVAQGLLLQVTVSGATGPGAIRVYANGFAPPDAPSAMVSTGAPVTTTVAVRMGGGGMIRLATDGPTVQCTVEVIGYTTVS